MSVPPTVTRLIESSGNNFHAKVARLFHGNGWHVVVSPYYMDQTQSKARELDLIVEKLWPIRDTWGQQQGNVAVRLFVECKFIASEAVFWFAAKNTESATALVCRSGLFRENNPYTEKHHYIATCPRVGKIFTSSNAKAQENEPFYKALNQALNATVALRWRSPSHPSLGGRRGGTLVTLEYPVVICSSFSQLYAVDFLAESPASQITENFQIEVQYAYLDRTSNSHDDYFLLDVVEFDQLTDYEAAIAESAKAAAYLARSD